MRRVLLPALLSLAAACAPAAPGGAFVAGLLEPVSPRVAAEARRLGLAVAVHPPDGVPVEDAAVVLPSGGERLADHARLRFLAWRAAARGAPGVFFRLPGAPTGADLIDLAEEWQAVARLARELRLARDVMERGVPVRAPLRVPDGVDARAWRHQRRVYVLLVNVSSAPAVFDAKALAGRRGLFAPRAAAAEALPACAGGVCLAPEGVLWLEGRLRR